jgi:lipoate---protein ligase
MTFKPLFSEHSDFLPEEPLGESLLLEEGSGLRIWQPKSTVIVLGRSQKAEKEVYLEASKADRIPVFKRYGGGGCVVLDEHSVCVAFRYERGNSIDITSFLEHSTKAIQSFLNDTYDLGVEIKENYDLTLDNKKFLGSSLYMPKGTCLYSCVILMNNAALEKINKYLKFPSKVPEHRKGRDHSEFLIPLQNKLSVSIENFMIEMACYFDEYNVLLGPC